MRPKRRHSERERCREDNGRHSEEIKKCTARKGIRETHKRVEMRRRKSTSSLRFFFLLSDTHKYKKSCSSFDSDIRRMHCNKFADVATFMRCQLEMN